MGEGVQAVTTNMWAGQIRHNVHLIFMVWGMHAASAELRLSEETRGEQWKTNHKFSTRN